LGHLSREEMESLEKRSSGAVGINKVIKSQEVQLG